MKVRFLLMFCFILGIFMLNVNAVFAVSRTIYVEAGKEKVESIGLKAEDQVSGKISIVDDSGDGINFYVTDPDGNVIVQHEKTTVENFRFTASKEGIYKLHFDNSFSTSRKTVTFNYDVRHYIFGIPQEDFLVFVVMTVALIGLVLFVAMSRP